MLGAPRLVTAAVLGAALAASLGACGDKSAAPGGPGAQGVTALPPPPKPKDAFPEGLLLTSSPGEAADIGSAKKFAKEGDTVILRGRIGGGPEPFVVGAAAMSIVDRKLVPCSEMKMEASCKTPWDYCCAPKDELTANSATVQVVGADGRPLQADLRTAGLAPLAKVIVKGKVGPRPDPKVLVVDAVGIFVEKDEVAAKDEKKQ